MDALVVVRHVRLRDQQRLQLAQFACERCGRTTIEAAFLFWQRAFACGWSSPGRTGVLMELIRQEELAFACGSKKFDFWSMDLVLVRGLRSCFFIDWARSWGSMDFLYVGSRTWADIFLWEIGRASCRERVSR